ncbi:transglycosylase SLT domain-containing protein, partial [Oceanospirillum sp. HFRX-1_2]
IMETESHFNPYATSHIPAYGLMQVVPSTAGRDVFQRIKKRNDQPTRSYLFNPTNNIDTGTAYLSILDDIYLKDVKHPLAREYCVISAYNGGAGNVLRTFSRDRKHAVKVINSLTPQQVYVKLNRSHPSVESRK